MISNEDKLLIQFLMGDRAFSDSKYSVDYYHISNPDGSIRWLFPKSQKEPSFLSFYSTSSVRAKILGAIIRLAFLVKIPGLVTTGSISLSVAECSRLGRVLSKSSNCDHSIFTGTLGENRKLIVEISNGKRSLAFVKIGIADSSVKLVEREVSQLRYLSGLSFKIITIPKVVDATEIGVVELSNIKPRNSGQYAKISELHIAALNELYNTSHRRIPWNKIISIHACREALVELIECNLSVDTLSDDRVRTLLGNVEVIIEKLQHDIESAEVSIAHGDFTPWNMYIAKGSVYLFDWELSSRNMPMLFDLIHFVFQSQVMIARSSYESIRIELIRIAKLESFKKLVDEFNIDFIKHYQFYLANTIVYYLAKYAKQGSLHEQASRLFDVWEAAVSDLLAKDGFVFSE